MRMNRKGEWRDDGGVHLKGEWGDYGVDRKREWREDGGESKGRVEGGWE